MTEQQFIANIKNVTKSRNHSIKNSVGVEDFLYEYLKENKDISSHTIRSIIKTINLELANSLSSGEEIKFPRQMGGLELRSNDTYVKFKDGKLKTNRMIDWNATLKLWYNNKEAKNKKQLVRLENKKIFSVFYNRGKAKFTNQVFYEFIPNRALKQKIKENIQLGNISDTFIYD